MTKDEALKLALEALKCAKATTSTPGNFLFFEEAITAIKEALAQPEQDYPENFIHALAFHTAISDLEPEQEPVAFVKGWNCGRLEVIVRSLNQRFEIDQPLYTTPPQRKPLTDEEINDIAKNYALNNPTTPLHFARAIEAAHGIKE